MSAKPKDEEDSVAEEEEEEEQSQSESGDEGEEEAYDKNNPTISDLVTGKYVSYFECYSNHIIN